MRIHKLIVYEILGNEDAFMGSYVGTKKVELEPTGFLRQNAGENRERLSCLVTEPFFLSETSFVSM